MAERATFTGKVGFILAAAGAAVGLGNIWRFPTAAASNGGGTFLLVYILIVALFGMAMVCTEIALGRRSGRSALHAYGFFDRRASVIGALSVLVPVLIYPYYSVIGGWILGYLGSYAMGIDTTGAGFFQDFSGSWTAAGCAVLFLSVAGIVVYLGVSKGIERTSTLFMPVFVVLLVALVAYVAIQPGMLDGFSYYLRPDLSRIDTDLFTVALGQAFYSLSLAMGITITYGSYMKKDEDIERSASMVVVIDTAIAFIAGLLIVPVAFNVFGGDIPSGAGLVFISLPGIFDGMPGGTVVAVVFFVMLAIAALTSAIALLEAIVSSVIDRFGFSRHRSVAVVVIPSIAAGIVISLGFGPLDWVNFMGMGILDLLDYLSNSVIMPIVALLMCIFVGHVLGPKVIVDEIESSGRFALKKVYPLMIRWVFPILVFIILVSGTIL